MKKRILDIKKSLSDIYLILLFFTYNLILVDVTVLGMSLKTVFLVIVTIMFILIHMIRQGFEKVKGTLSHIDLVMALTGGLSFLVFIFKMIVEPADYTDSLNVLILCLVYYLIRIQKEAFREDVILIFSAANTIISVMILWYYVVNKEAVLPVKLLMENKNILSWLILMITVNVTGYCIYENLKFWYGFNAIIGFFLLFIQKNLIAIGIVGGMFLLIPLVYAPTKRIIRSTMQMFFIYASLLCNMSLITGYTGMLEEVVAYDLEISVYLELGLALFGVMFFYYWDKYTTEEDDDKKLLPEMKEFFQKIMIALGILTVVFMTAIIKGGTNILPDIFGKLIEQGREGLSSQTGSFEAVAQYYGSVGIIIVMYLYYAVFRSLIKRRKPRVSKHQKLFRMVTALFTVQSLFLTQSMVTMPIYIAFLVPYLKDLGLLEPKKKTRGEETNEANHSDSVL